MGTSSAYGGSPGWEDAQDETESWLDTSPESGGDEGGGGEGDQEPPPGDSPVAEGEPETSPEEGGGAIDPSAASMLASITGRLQGQLSGRSGGGRGGGGGVSSGGGGSGGGGGGRKAAASSGGAAIAGTYGLLTGDADALGDVGLTMEELDGLSPLQQARRIVNAASPSAALIEDDELREVNARFVWQIISEGDPLSPADLVKTWLTEFVFRAWLTEAGSVLRDGNRSGSATHAIEREARSTLEAAVERLELPSLQVRATDLEGAISRLLGQLTRIFQEVAA